VERADSLELLVADKEQDTLPASFETKQTIEIKPITVYVPPTIPVNTDTNDRLLKKESKPEGKLDRS
jgi:hypothetical protein